MQLEYLDILSAKATITPASWFRRKVLRQTHTLTVIGATYRGLTMVRVLMLKKHGSEKDLQLYAWLWCVNVIPFLKVKFSWAQ